MSSAAPSYSPRFSSSVLPLLVKIVLLGLVDAFAVAVAMALAAAAEWLVLGVVVLVTVVINVIYLVPNRFLPGKYLAPGLIFLLVFQVFIVLYSGYVAFTNYGDGHNSSKTDAIAAIQANNQERVNDTEYPCAIAEKDGRLWVVVAHEGKVLVGSSEEPLREAAGAELGATGAPVKADGFTILQLGQLLSRSSEVTALSVPFSSDPGDGYLRTPTGQVAYLYQPSITYDKGADTMTARDGTVYRDTGTGAFVSDDGRRIEPGWKINVGFANFSKAFGEQSIRGPLLKVTSWTFAFAFLSVLTTFALGLFLAIVFNDPRMRGRRVYRTIMILPYAFPAFLSGLVWSGLFNPEFGFINDVLLGGTHVDWVNNAWLARLTVLIANLWLGFPYMFLVSTGALQAIPEEVMEAARVDGATALQTFWHIKLPLLMVPLAPLLISSFAFNFNNFSLIYMLTKGGPRFPEAGIDAGGTDLLISLVYKVAFGAGTGRDYGLASAFAIIIFIVIAAVSYLGFRQTKSLEELA
ncbi:MAG: ABC transporter permease subunit [Actinomycetia bacterium]|nr:ABC transporter permease subunit [Actinomycetes bacterium]